VSLIADGPVVKRGATDPRLPLVREKLAARGYGDAGLPPGGDPLQLDDALSDQLRLFQKWALLLKEMKQQDIQLRYSKVSWTQMSGVSQARWRTRNPNLRSWVVAGKENFGMRQRPWGQLVHNWDLCNLDPE
jgi:hypothetical protein